MIQSQRYYRNTTTHRQQNHVIRQQQEIVVVVTSLRSSVPCSFLSICIIIIGMILLSVPQFCNAGFYTTPTTTPTQSSFYEHKRFGRFVTNSNDRFVFGRRSDTISRLRAATIDDTSTTSSSLVSSKESKRLVKAKLLLEQFQQGDEETLVPPAMILSSASVSSTTSSGASSSAAAAATSANGKQQQQHQLTVQAEQQSRITTTSRITVKSPSSSSSSSSPTSNDDTTIVPDMYWRNGHLQDFTPTDTQQQPTRFVTRWARGANVAEPLVQYDPIKAEKLLFRQPTKWVVRNFQIAIPLGLWAVNVVMDYILYGRDENPVSKSTRRRERAQQLTKAISSLGPAIIKGGQALASRPDLLPAEYLEELQKLQDDVPRFSNEVALRTVEQELGIAKFTDVFELVQTEPVAAASIGQVYKARLVENNDIVALKIQRPSCEEIVALDLYILRWWSGIYNQIIFRLLNRDIDLQNIIDDFGILIYRELDYIAEASNAQRFNELYAGISDDVFVPKIYSDYTTSRVLTMEWVDGYRITDTKIMSALQLDVRKLVNTLVQCSVRQILENGFFHADPHAGNLLACPDGRLCYLDFGMMSYANQKQRNGFLLAVIHIVNRDWDELAKLYVKLGFIPAGTDLEPIVQALEQALPDVLNSDISELNFKNVINSLGDVFYTFPFSLPPFYIAIIRCLGVLEGLAIQVDPSIKVISECYPYVASRVLTDKQDDLQEAFRRLALTNDGRIRWERLEGLLEQARGVSDYDTAAALDIVTDYILSDDSGTIVQDLAIQLVDYMDTLGSETSQYVMEALKAFSINDEVAAVRAFRSISDIIQSAQQTESLDSVTNRVKDELRDGLPELTPSMKRLATISTLVLGSGSNGDSSSSSSASSKKSSQGDLTKYLPVVRKLTSSTKVQNAASEVIARLGERMLSRSLRAVFGLPPPAFRPTATTAPATTAPAGTSRSLSRSLSTVTEDREEGK